MRITLGVMKVNLLLVLLFALVFNWPIFLHFYTILTRLEHVKTGFALSIPFVLLAALNAVFLPFTFRYLLKPFYTSSWLPDMTMVNLSALSTTLSMPRIIWAKKGPPHRSPTSTPMQLERLLTSAWAKLLGRKLSSFMAAMTASRFSGATCAVLLMTRDTVEMDTLANRETSLIVATINSFVGGACLC